MKFTQKNIAQYRHALTVVLGLLLTGPNAHAKIDSAATDTQLQLPSLFSNDMVLQRDQPILIWGQAEPGMRIAVLLDDHRTVTTANDKGQWESRLPAMPAGGPCSLVVSSENVTRTFNNVVLGDIWVCSGQSNMAWPVDVGLMKVENASTEKAQANWPDLRFLTVSKNGSRTPRKDVDSKGWAVCQPETVGPFSAVGYFFGREVHKRLSVPIGLINSSYGGTMAEAWTSEDGLRTVPELSRLVDAIQKHPDAVDRIRERYDAEFAAWKRKLDRLDRGYENGTPVWAQPDLNDSYWKKMMLPGYWEERGYPDLDGLMWFRKDIRLPASWKDKNLRIHFGPVNDRIRVWFNGVEIVNWTGGGQPATGYEIPARIVRAEHNTIAIRVYDMGNNGGMLGNADDFWLRCENLPDANGFPLVGSWRCAPGYAMVDHPPLPRPPLLHPENPNTPCHLFNGMIAPLTRFPIRGVIWYQGEGNAKRAHAYRSLFPALIQDWRSHWSQADLPFLFVQLANFRPVNPEPEESAWAELREAQTMALSLNTTGMAVTIDIGDTDDVHPRNKQDVGYRLALAARHVAYGEKNVYSGPSYVSHAQDDGALRLTFTHAGTGLTTKESDPLRGFAIAGKDRLFVWAQAEIDGNSVRVWNEEVPDPVAVRYAWANNPVCNLYNREGLPAVPFRTDNWPGVTRHETLTLNLEDESATDWPHGFKLVCDLAYGDVSAAQRLDMVYPTDSARRLPAIVMIHGGGWRYGGKDGDKTRRMMANFAKAGFVALSVGYRLSDEAVFPAAVEDCKLAIRWLRANASTYGVDPNAIGAIGPSAGGHLSALLAVTRTSDSLEGDGGLNDRSSELQASVAVCGPFDLRIPLTPRLAENDDPLVVSFLGGSLKEKAVAARQASPITYVRRDQPPLLIVHGTADARVDVRQAMAMAEAVKSVGAPSELILVKDGGHGMGIARTENVFSQILAFFQEHLSSSGRSTGEN